MSNDFRSAVQNQAVAVPLQYLIYWCVLNVPRLCAASPSLDPLLDLLPSLRLRP